MQYDIDAIPGNVRALRAMRRVSQSSLAEAVGVNKDTIMHYEQGKSVPTLTTACKLANYFGTSVDWICKKHV